jgi:hypothetical protein
MTTTSKATHTAGPWKIGRTSKTHNAPVRYWETSVFNRIIGVTATGSGGTQEEAEANARLIAAAPEMLEALEDVESKIVDYEAGRINWRPDDFLMRVREAITKARGGM